MTDDRLFRDLEVDEGEPVADLLRTLGATYVRDELPRVGSELAAAFTEGLAGAPRPDTAPVGTAPARRVRSPFRWATARIALGGAAVFVNLVGVGSAGWLPGPVQTAFERAATSVGVDVPAASPNRRPALQPEGRSVPADAPATERDSRDPAGRVDAPTGQTPVSPGGTTAGERDRRAGAPVPGGASDAGPRPGSGGMSTAPTTTTTRCPTVPTTVVPPQLAPPTSTPGLPVPGAIGGLPGVPVPVEGGPQGCPTTTSTSRP